jgi:hypothetical protein
MSNIQRVLLLELMELVIQFTMSGINNIKLKVLSCEDGVLWTELSQDIDQWRTSTLVLLKLLFCYQQVSLDVTVIVLF